MTRKEIFDLSDDEAITIAMLLGADVIHYNDGQWRIGNYEPPESGNRVFCYSSVSAGAAARRFLFDWYSKPRTHAAAQ